MTPEASAETGSGVALHGVSAGHGRNTVLHGIDLAVERGEVLVVLGPSGAGKSTLLRVIAGLTPVTAGQVRIAGRDVTTLRPGLRDVAMVFQSYALFPHLTVAQNIAFGPAVRGSRPREVARRLAEAAAETVGCAHLLDRRPDQLSGGERQRVALARAVVREPEVYLFDEPLSNLDSESRLEMRGELKALHQRVGGTTVHVTHDQAEALVLGDRIAVLRDGRLEQVGTPDEIWRTPATTFVARFVGSPGMNLVPRDGGRTAGFRPEAVHLTGDPRASVERVDVIGEDAYVYLRAGGHRIVARVPAAARPPIGAQVGWTVDPAAEHTFDTATGRRL